MCVNAVGESVGIVARLHVSSVVGQLGDIVKIFVCFPDVENVEEVFVAVCDIPVKGDCVFFGFDLFSAASAHEIDDADCAPDAVVIDAEPDRAASALAALLHNIEIGNVRRFLGHGQTSSSFAICRSFSSMR